MTGKPGITSERWQRRIDRARELEREYPEARSPLSFYHETLVFQSEVAGGLARVVDRAKSLREQIDPDVLCSSVPSLLAVAARCGPDALRIEGKRLNDGGQSAWRRLLESALLATEDVLGATDDFFARACLQPLAEYLQLQTPRDQVSRSHTCPACGDLPQMAILRPEGEGASRSLLCSFCLHEWNFRRLACPWCGEESKDKLPRYSAEECTYVHVEACDTCKHYIKAIDMTTNGHAVPLVDEVALAVLDVWAADRSYTKVRRNLVGF